MSRTRQALYEKRSRQRREIRAAAAFNGWVDLDVLAAFTDPVTGAFMVFDLDGARYLSQDDAPPVPALAQAELVAPADIPTVEIGPRWQKLLPELHKVSAPGKALDLTVGSRGDALAHAEQLAASALALVKALRENNGPDWHEAIGLTEIPS